MNCVRTKARLRFELMMLAMGKSMRRYVAASLREARASDCVIGLPESGPPARTTA